MDEYLSYINSVKYNIFNFCVTFAKLVVKRRIEKEEGFGSLLS
jgi:hypothetical protein